jgi:hypothetical protein
MSVRVLAPKPARTRAIFGGFASAPLFAQAAEFTPLMGSLPPFLKESIFFAPLGSFFDRFGRAHPSSLQSSIFHLWRPRHIPQGNIRGRDDKFAHRFGVKCPGFRCLGFCQIADNAEIIRLTVVAGWPVAAVGSFRFVFAAFGVLFVDSKGAASFVLVKIDPGGGGGLSPVVRYPATRRVEGGAAGTATRITVSGPCRNPQFHGPPRSGKPDCRWFGKRHGGSALLARCCASSPITVQ